MAGVLYNHPMSISWQSMLRTSAPPVVAFSGAGGKTTAMFQLARELDTARPVIVTATAHLGAWQIPLADRHLIVKSSDPIVEQLTDLQGVLLITGALTEARTQPLDANSLIQLRHFCAEHALPLLIEADGSRQKPLKAWAEHEPPIPDFVEVVVEVAGLSGIGKPVQEDHIQRAARFAELSGLQLGDTVTTETLIRVLTHPEGGQKNIPPGARKIILLNQADTPELQALAQSMAQHLLGTFHAVAVANLEKSMIHAVHERIAGIVLAGGESKRLGRPKQLLDWKGQSFVRAVTRTALEAGLAPVVVVTGANAAQVEAELDGLNVVVARNEAWPSGQASSLRAGLQALSAQQAVGGSVFLLVDQPQVNTSILRALVEKHAEGLYPAVVPLVMDHRANPVLFDRVTFPDLLQLEGDVGGRAVFHKHRPEFLPWHDDRLMLDVDTEEQYQRLTADETL